MGRIIPYIIWNIKHGPNRQPEMISDEYSIVFCLVVSTPNAFSNTWPIFFVDGGIIIPTDHRTVFVPFGAFPFFHIPNFERSGDTWGWLPSFWQLEGVKTIRKIAEDLRRIPPQQVTPLAAVIVHLRSVSSAVHITCNKENWFVSVHVRKCSATRAGSYADLLIPPGTRWTSVSCV